MVGRVFVGQQADLPQRVKDQAVVAEADVVAVALFEDARLDAVGLSVVEAVLDHVAGQFFYAQGEVVSPGAVAVVLVTELPNGICEGHYVVHLGDGYIKFILLEHVESVREQEDPVPETFAVDFDAAALNCNDDAVVAHDEQLGDGIGQPDGVRSEGGHHGSGREDQEAGLADEARNGRQAAFSDPLEVVEVDQVEAVDGHSDCVAADCGYCQAERLRVSFDVQGCKLGCQNPDQRSDPRSNDKCGLQGSKKQALHHGAVFFADQYACQKCHGISHSYGDRIKEGIRLSMHRIGGNSSRGGDDSQHSVHENAADGVSQAADAGGHSFAQDLGGFPPGKASECEAKKSIFFAKVGEKDAQRDIIADAGGDAHLKGASVEDQDCRQVHHDVRDCQSDGTDDGKVPIIVEGHEAVEYSDQVHGRQAKGDSDQIPSGLREKFRVVPGSAQSACDGSGEYDEKEHKRRSKSCGKNTGQGENLLGLFCFAGAEKSCEAVAGACDDHCADD